MTPIKGFDKVPSPIKEESPGYSTGRNVVLSSQDESGHDLDNPLTAHIDKQEQSQVYI